MKTWSRSSLAVLAIVMGCGGGGSPSRDEAATTEVASEPPSRGAPGFAGGDAAQGKVAGAEQPPSPLVVRGRPTGVDTVAPSMIIRTGQVIIEVESLSVGMAAVRDLAKRVGGYVANSSVQAGGEEAKSATLEIKLPASRFDEAISGLSRIGEVESQNVTAEDVGEEFVDITARVTNARRLEARLIELLANRTGKLQDVLAVERELARIREEIERYEGRLRYLRTRAAISTLTITVHEPRPVVGERGSSNVLAEAFRNAWRNFVGFIALLISSTGFLIPLAVLGVAAFFAVRRFKPRRPDRGKE